MIHLFTGEEILGNYTRTVGYQKPKPSILGLKNGTTVITNTRIIFLRSRLGETRYDNMEKVEKDLQKGDSFYVNRDDVTEVFSDTKFRIPYVTLEYVENGEYKYASFASEDYDSTINLILMFRRELQEKDPNYIKKKRKRDKVIIDQTHDQTEIAFQPLRTIIRVSAIDQQCEDPIFISDKKSWDEAKDMLKETAMFISIGTQQDKFDQNDTDSLKEYVQNGGTLFITPEPKKKPPNKLAGVFGIRFGEKAIQDKKNHGVFRDHIIVKDFHDHPANKEVETIMFGDYGCYPIYLSQNKGVPIAVSSKDSDPPNSIVAAEIDFGEGRVLAIGQARIFMDDYLGKENNLDWFNNLMDYGLSMDKGISTISPTPESLVIEEALSKPKFCANCGHKLESGNKFCGNCGQKIN